jgi:hypothetical protein
VRVGVARPPTPFYYIYYNVQSCGVRSSWEDRYTPIFLLYSYMYSVYILRLKYAWIRNFPKLVEKTITLLTHYLVEVSQSFSRYPILSLKSMVIGYTIKTDCRYFVHFCILYFAHSFAEVSKIRWCETEMFFKFVFYRTSLNMFSFSVNSSSNAILANSLVAKCMVLKI